MVDILSWDESREVNEMGVDLTWLPPSSVARSKATSKGRERGGGERKETCLSKGGIVSRPTCHLDANVFT